MFGDNKTEVLAATLTSEGAPTGAPSTPRKRGRPKGSKNKPKDSVTGSPNNTSSSDGDSSNRPFVYNADPAGIAAAATAFKFIWSLCAPFAKVRELTEEEGMKAGEALDPILQKYIPIYSDWKYEINLAMIVVGLYQVCHADWKNEHPDTGSEATIVE